MLLGVHIDILYGCYVGVRMGVRINIQYGSCIGMNILYVCYMGVLYVVGVLYFHMYSKPLIS